MLSAFMLAALFGFIAVSVNAGLLNLTQTNLQNIADGAALAASHEITGATYQAVQAGKTVDINALAAAASRQVAADLATANGAYIDPNADVKLGRRAYDPQSKSWSIQWDAQPYNAVQVTVRRDQPNTSQGDGEVPLSFHGFLNRSSAPLSATATAYIEARDIVIMLDYSGSMNYDSLFVQETLNKLGQTAIEANLNDIWQDLGSPLYGNLQFATDFATVTKAPGAVTWTGPTVDVEFLQAVDSLYLEYSSGLGEYFGGGSPGQLVTLQGTGSYSGQHIRKAWLHQTGGNWFLYDFYDTQTIKNALGLVDSDWPYPVGSWDNYIDYCRDANGSTPWYDYNIFNTGHRRKFGMLTLVEFWLKKQKQFHQTPDLWKTRHYPFHAVKEGASLLCKLLKELDYGDELGLVTYDTNSRVETGLNDTGMPYVDLGTNLITAEYNKIDVIQTHKQAAHYGRTTNIGGGMQDSIDLLNQHARYGAEPTIVVMTDGNTNVSDPNWSVPANWDWGSLTDYDGDGTADYTTSDQHKMYAIFKAQEAAALGIKIHSMAVGANADRGMMEAMAFIGGGVFINIPGGSSVSQMESQVKQAFRKVAARVPAPKLVYAP